MIITKAIVAFVLAFSLVLCPIVKSNKIYAAINIPDSVVGACAAVGIALGYSWENFGEDVADFLRSVIDTYLQISGWQSVIDWLGQDYQVGFGVEGKYFYLSPDLFVKFRALFEFAVQQGDMPSGGSASEPVVQTVSGGYFLSNISINGTTYPQVQCIDLRSRINGSMTMPFGYFKGIVLSDYPPDNFTISYPSPLVSFTNQYTITHNNITITPSIVSLGPANGYQNNVVAISGLGNQQYYAGWTSVVGINNPSYNTLNIDSSYPVKMAFAVHDRNGLTIAVPVLIYRTMQGTFLLTTAEGGYFNSYLVPFGGNSSLDQLSHGQPNYDFDPNNNIYIDLQLGTLSDYLSALLALLQAINDNLITFTIAIQSSNPENLPVDTTPFIDLVDYCNEQTNLYLSGTVSLSECAGNMYQNLYTTISNINNPALSDACINAYNAFINKLTLFSHFQSTSGSDSQVVQDFISDLEVIYQGYVRSAGSSLSPTISQVMERSATAFQTALSQASTVEEIIGLNTAYEEFMLRIDNLYTRSTYARSSAAALNTIVDNYLSGSIDRGTALTNLLTRYKSDISSAKSVYDCTAIVSAYQACLDRISLEDLSIDPNGLGDTADEVITMEDDLLTHIDLDELSVMLDFQNWTYINSSEGSLYREFFQKIMDSSSPFYLFIYIPMILGIVGIVLGTRITLPHKVKASHDDSISKGRGT